ncbi:hypothetical protein ABE52_33905 [Bacillus thuringiensis]|uniref:DUF5068 domain-containing protein n=1 Tax=Bacillus thuringiensis YBT-1518 TaxID=529122 RepID=A0A9W3K9F6_BACTU|nr:DUF5068 domain-containing protein [Bacillus thuringiensis]AHA69396.1 hypothetical protein YBT1518_00800 [Bacillus thuringiensis YBT-1518]MBG9486946.1 hypothetical protein [Bacillus thuringiensis]MBG9507279.1 hypothetical protein [Bacillus thuringiensis]
MSKKLLSLFSAVIVAAFVITGCGQSDTTNKEQKENATKESKTEKTDTTKESKPTEKKSEDKKTEDKKPENTATGSSDYSKLISYMEKETGGKTKVLFENKEPQVYKAEDVSVSMNSYTLVELNGFHTNFDIPFNRQTEGGVILVNYSVKNSSAKDIYYMPALDMSFTGAQKAYSNYKDLIPKEDQLPTAQANKGKFDAPIGNPGSFSLSLNKQGAEKVATDNTFYQDKATANNMGDKKMLKEKSSINNNQELGAVNVTLDGYQFTQFTPNSVEAPRFANFKNGLVLLTVKFKLDNKDAQDVSLSPISSTLRVNDGTQYTINEGMLLNYDYNAAVKTGTSGELLQVYILDQEQYEKIWKDKSFEIELGPMRNKEAKDISQGKKAKFTLPK